MFPYSIERMGHVLQYGETHASLIEDIKRVPRDFFSISDWTCDGAGN